MSRLPELKPPSHASATPGRTALAAASPVWQVWLLGGFRLADDQQQHTRLRSSAATLLLARLAMAPHRAHSREELIALLWPDAPQDAGRNRLRQALWYLKSLLEPPGAPTVLLPDRRSVRVAPDTLWCDAAAFEAAVRGGDHARALALYEGELLPGFYAEWVHDERQRLQALADRLAETGPQRGAAAPGLAVPPGHGAPLPRHPGNPQAQAAQAATPGALPRPAETRLPQYLTRLIGADVSGARLRDLVLEHRLVTVLGPGGSGKTRLAVEVARLLCEAEGVAGADVPAFERAIFVSLVGCVSSTQLLDQLLLTLRVASTGEPLGSILGALDSQALLVVLDNCEELDEGAIAQVAGLAEQLPRVHWLASSRRPLGLDGEYEFLLEPLTLPAPDALLTEVVMNPAVALFVDRARAHRLEFHITTGNRDSVVALVRWLDGLPLAIELAASRARTFAPAETLALLNDASSQPGTAALAWLSRRGARSGRDSRQASMLAVIDWSWKLLPAELQQALQAICLFPAGASTAALAALAEPPEPLAAAQARLDALVGHSVVQQRRGQDGVARYQATEPVRQYAAAQLDAAQAASLRRRLRQRTLHWAETLPATPPLAGVREELPNLLAVISAAVADGHGDDAARLILQLQVAWGEIALPAAALDTLRDVLAAPGLDVSLAAGGHALVAWSNFEAGRRDAALAHAEQALALDPPDGAVRANVLSRVARLRWRITRDPVLPRALITQALPLARAHGRHNTEAALLSVEAAIAHAVERDTVRAQALNQQALALWQRGGNAHMINAGRYNLATNDMRSGRHEQALATLALLAEEGRALQDWDMVSGSLDASGTSLAALRRWPEAARHHREALAVAWQALEMQAVVFALWNLPRALAHLGQPALAAQTMAFAEQCWQRRFGDLDQQDRLDIRRVQRLARCRLDADGLAQAWRLGRERTLAQAVRAALDADLG